MRTLLDDRSYQKQIDRIIKHGKGTDVDTNAAIAGALLGMRDGFNNLMENRTTADNWNVMLVADTIEGDFPRPKIYTLHKFDKNILKYYRVVKSLGT